jgi:hypothetical protein
MLRPLDTAVLKSARSYIQGPHLRKYSSRKICICDTYLQTRITKLYTFNLAASVFCTGWTSKQLKLLVYDFLPAFFVAGNEKP